MSSLPIKCLVDTNVPKTANLAIDPSSIPNELLDCTLACVEAVDHIINKGELVLDAGGEIFDEYLRNLSISRQPGMGNRFMKWVNDHRWMFPEEDSVTITSNGDSYDEFPDHPGLINFDIDDRKFVAVAHAHPKKPPIIQGTDSKWWGWKDALADMGISVRFLCPEYVEAKNKEKIKK